MTSDVRDYPGKPVSGLATNRVHVFRIGGWELVAMDETEQVDEPDAAVSPPPAPLAEGGGGDDEAEDDWDLTGMDDGSE